ncbi:hypothetical protein GEMRC1_010714 [Eukaryota sp. GEM-RC1]
MTNTRPYIIHITGPPAVGKGTQSDLILKNYPSFTHISVGDILRLEAKDTESPFADEVSELLAGGHIVPSSLAMPILRRWVEKKGELGFKCIIIDGFPRAMDQALMHEQELGLPSILIHLDAPKDVVLARTLNRAKEAIEQGETPRSDDNEAKFEHRFSSYLKTTFPVIEHYKSNHSGIFEYIDGSLPVEQVFDSVVKVLKKHSDTESCL